MTAIAESASPVLWPIRKQAYRAAHATTAVGSAVLLRTFYWWFAPGEGRAPPKEAIEVMRDRFAALLDRDLANVEAGYYPERLLYDYPVARYARAAAELLGDAPKLVQRRRDDRHEDLPEHVDRSRFPRYYLRNFHWQTDGWFSRRSARMYDPSVEILFGGTADLMRRMAIPPLVDALGRDTAARIVDLGCGTGRFLRQLASALPRARFTGVDLSSFYLKEAAANLEDVEDTSLMVDNAEATSFSDECFDAVTSIFLFHELPRSARRNVLSEAFRLMKPGAPLVLVDAAQLLDSPSIAFALEGFSETYHEPYFRDYIRNPLEGMVEAAGFEVISSEPYTVSKLVVAKKP